MFKLIGIAIGASVVLFVALAWSNPEEAKTPNVNVQDTSDQSMNPIIEQGSQQTPEASKEKVGVTDVIEDDPAVRVPVDEQSQPQDRPLTENEPLTPMDTVDPEPIVENSDQQWHIFWSPFSRSASAQGFAERISAETGLTINVVDENTGRFMVAFGYHDEADRQAALETIENKTGLKIKDKKP